MLICYILTWMFADLHVLFYFMYIVECLLIFMSFLLLAYCFVAVKVINHNVVIGYLNKLLRPTEWHSYNTCLTLLTMLQRFSLFLCLLICKYAHICMLKCWFACFDAMLISMFGYRLAYSRTLIHIGACLLTPSLICAYGVMLTWFFVDLHMIYFVCECLLICK